MTVIAWDGNMLAADKLTTFGHERSLRPTSKILARNGRLYGVAGISGYLEPLAAWYESGAKRADVPACDEDWSMLVVEADGRLLHVHSRAQYPIEVAAPFAIGSGGEFATGAMMAKATALDAVMIASRLCTQCGNGADVLFPPLKIPAEAPQKEAAE